LYWDNSNSFLGVGTATPGARLQVNGTGLLTATAFSVKDSGGTDSFTVLDNGNTYVRGVLTVSGSSASNATTLMGRTVSGEVASISLGTNLSFSGNTLNATGGGGTPAGSTGEVQFNNAGAFGASSNFNWDNTNSRLGIRTATPGASLQIVGAGTTSGTTSFLVQSSGTTELMSIKDNGNINFSTTSTGLYWDNVNKRLGIGTSTPSSVLNVIGIATVSSSLSISGGLTMSEASNIHSYTAPATNRTLAFVTNSNSFRLFPTGSFSIGTTSDLGRCAIRTANTTSGVTAFLVQNSTPSDLYKIENNGKINYWATNTAAGTTGAVTIDRPSGTVNFAAAASALTVTNTLCTTSSIVFATVRTNDTTAYIKNVVPGAGSFTINLGAAATAETSVGFFIIN
jgi:hypothetical protein